MAQIVAGREIATLINVFSVAPERQQELLQVLIEATEKVIRDMPGFVSANLHASVDGTKVVNYAQWRSSDDFNAMLRDPKAIPHVETAARIATSFEPHLYHVAYVDEAPA